MLEAGKQSAISFFKGKNVVTWFWYVSLCIMSATPIIDSDFFWHIKVGEHIVNTRAIPLFDMFSYHEGLYYFAHEWLFDVLLFGIWKTGGFLGIQLFVGVIFLGIICLLHFIIFQRTRNWLVSVFLTSYSTILLSKAFIVPRPQIISFLLALIILWYLERNNILTGRVKYGRRFLIKGAIILSFIAILWVNVHGGSYPLLFILLGITGLDAISALLEKPSISTRNWLLCLLVFGFFSLASVSLNPYFFKMYTFPFVLTGDVATYHIMEWQNYEFRGLAGYAMALLLMMPFLSIILSGRQPKVRDLLGIMLFTSMGLQSQRHLGLVILFNTIFMAEYFSDRISAALENIVHMATQAIRKFMVTGIVLVAVLSMILWNHLSEFKLVDTSTYPVAALQFIEDSGIDVHSVRMLNDYNWGGYLIFRDYPVFIDGRADIYQRKTNPSTTLLEDYYKIVHLYQVDELLEKYDIQYVLIESGTKLDWYLESSPHWKLEFEDDDEGSALFTRL